MLAAEAQAEATAQLVGEVRGLRADLARFERKAQPVLSVFDRWEQACVWLRAKTPKHGWWLIGVIWVFSNFVSPELKAALNQWMAVLIQNMTSLSAAG